MSEIAVIVPLIMVTVKPLLAIWIYKLAFLLSETILKNEHAQQQWFMKSREWSYRAIMPLLIHVMCDQYIFLLEWSSEIYVCVFSIYIYFLERFL